MSAEHPGWINALSEARFRGYLKTAGGDVDVAARLYQWNLDVSAAFYSPLHWLEVTLRNALHEQLRAWCGRDDWWSAVPLRKKGPQLVHQAERNLAKEKGSFTVDDVVAKLSLGFWVSLVSRQYDRDLWRAALHKSFPHFRGPRGDLHEDLEAVRCLRNRIMHHEPIHHLDLLGHRERVYRVLRHLSAGLPGHAASADRIPEVWEQRPLGTAA